MVKWECKIEKVDNGFICTTYVPEEEDDVYVEHKNVFTDPADYEVKEFVDLVWFLAEYYGVLGSKHDKERLWVGLVDQEGKQICG